MDLTTAPRVQDTILKRRKVREKVQAQKAADKLRQAKQKKKSNAASKDNQRFKTPESIIRTHRALIRNIKIAKHMDKQAEHVRKSLVSSGTMPIKRKRDISKIVESRANVGEEKSKKPKIEHAQDHFIPDEMRSNILLAMRMGGVAQSTLPKRQENILRALRLREVNTAVFLKRDQATLALLRRVENYVTYGHVSVPMIRELLQKRGFVRVKAGDIAEDIKQDEHHGHDEKEDAGESESESQSGKRESAPTKPDDITVTSKFVRTALSNNMLVEEALGDHGLVCVEDLVQELASGGENFELVNNFLFPFKLSYADKAKDAKRKSRQDYEAFGNGGQMGYRGDHINTLAQSML
mmetsp:Transcript_15565/g.27343  ORF Transcript_15565/g.27343 Transcript_15565/m.27343 type:complete len:352 (+) Transcript_15565:65-1120(+)|eukprot:CAMPEP_0184699216 /NCGR_PEP_ID=MMETSP0313-20130426/5567_1 /TAXON_ID=2792 /ORGANISM="Porphyridium aerugineum, Strain SAG 1380-2" /LENGTH=351 /DNA_ID=CAMNT_0027158273 /DNA_START=20 /DNA_END=1075 /DNA_ORIENTATION=-